MLSQIIDTVNAYIHYLVGGNEVAVGIVITGYWDL